MEGAPCGQKETHDEEQRREHPAHAILLHERKRQKAERETDTRHLRELDAEGREAERESGRRPESTAKRRSEPEPVYQAEERARERAGPALRASSHLEPDEADGASDEDLDRALGDRGAPTKRERERGGMGEGECRHREEESLLSLASYDARKRQAEQEEQMIVAERDVFEAQSERVPGSAPGSRGVFVRTSKCHVGMGPIHQDIVVAHTEEKVMPIAQEQTQMEVQGCGRFLAGHHDIECDPVFGGVRCCALGGARCALRALRVENVVRAELRVVALREGERDGRARALSRNDRPLRETERVRVRRKAESQGRERESDCAQQRSQ